MKIRNVNIESFRCFDHQSLNFETTDGNLANLVVLYAPNGFGKTSLFDAIEYGITGSVNRFTKGVYNKDNIADKKLRDKHSFLFNKNVDPKREIKISIGFDDTFKDINRSFKVSEEDFYSTKNSKCNDFFKDVILSQEWFDFFVRSTSPEERCKIFFEYFGRKDDLLSYNKDLEEARTALKSAIATEEKEIKNLLADLKIEVKGDALILLQKAIEQYDGNDLDISSFKSINSESIKAFHIWVESKTDDISQELMKNEYTIQSISAILDGSSDCVTINALKDSKTILNNIKEQLHNTNAYLKRQERLLFILKKQDENTETIKKISDEKNIYDFYIDHEREISELLCRLYNLKNDKIKKEQILENIKSRLTVLNEERQAIQKLLNDKEKRFQYITNIHSNLKSLYDKYNENIIEKSKNEEALNNLKLHLVQLHENNSVLVAGITSIENFRKALEEKVDESLLIYNLYKCELLSILDDKKELINVEKAQREISNKKKEHELYNSEIQRLVNNSRTIYSELKDGICPLCGYNWENIDVLITNIESNDTINKTILYFSKQYEEQEKIAKAIKERILSKKNDLSKIVIQDISTKQNQILLNKNQIIDLEKQINNIHTQLKVIGTEIVKYDEIFCNMNLKRVEEKVDEEYNDIAKQLLNLRKKESEIRINIGSEEEGLLKTRSEINKLISELAVIEDGDFYQRTKKCYETLSNTFDSNTVDSWKEHSSALSSLLSEVNEDQRKIIKEIEQLHNIGINEFDKKSKVDALKRQTEEYKKSMQILSKYTIYINKLIKENISIEEAAEKVESRLLQEINGLKEIQNHQNKLLSHIKSFSNLIKNAEEYLGYNKRLNEIENKKKKIEDLNRKFGILKVEKERLSIYVKTYIDKFFDRTLINKLYNTIDPHPQYKQINFDCDFDKQTPRLCVKMATVNGNKDEIVPNLYFSSAQINILSFCIFLAKALNAKDDKGKDVNCIFIDDPIQAMDDINILSVVDLLRNIAFANDKQVLITTHDRNFYELMKKKCPSYIFSSKFFIFSEKGVIEKDC